MFLSVSTLLSRAGFSQNGSPPAGSVENVADSVSGRRVDRLTSAGSTPVTVLRRMSPAAVRGRD